jgi:hypothetical protein
MCTWFRSHVAQAAKRESGGIMAAPRQEAMEAFVLKLEAQFSVLKLEVHNLKDTVAMQELEVNNLKGAIAMQELQINNLKGAIAMQELEINNLKGATAKPPAPPNSLQPPALKSPPPPPLKSPVPRQPPALPNSLQPPALKSPPPLPATCCPDHGPGNVRPGGVKPPTGSIEDDFEAWWCHLNSTLFLHAQNKCIKLYEHMNHASQHFTIVACRTQANRFYYARCNRCNAGVCGDYGKYRNEQHVKDAGDTLLTFFKVTLPAEDESTVCQVMYRDQLALVNQ